MSQKFSVCFYVSKTSVQFSSVPSVMSDYFDPMAVHQASLSITNSQSLQRHKKPEMHGRGCGDPRMKEQIKPRRVLECRKEKPDP